MLIALPIVIAFLPLFIGLALLSSSRTVNAEEWIIKEDPQTGEIRVIVHRDVRRM